MKAFYVHHQVRYFGRARNGFTALIHPTENSRTVLFSVTYCSKKDAFCKKTGRSSVAQLIPTEVNKRDVPQLLAKAQAICEGHSFYNGDLSWQYIYRYML